MFLKKNQTNHTFKYFCQPCDDTYFFYVVTYFFLQLLSFIYDYYDLTISFLLLQMVRTCWLYYFSKFIELLDTVSICSLINEVVVFLFTVEEQVLLGA